MPVKGASGKRVLGIVGSPRRGGNTEILVDEVLSGAHSLGAVRGHADALAAARRAGPAALERSLL